ncbi:MAG: MBL fold metallo-hydrolase [Firmicutes bacterium]|nr:MBL fold metallo-hydrolase [Bacillota bacterium]
MSYNSPSEKNTKQRPGSDQAKIWSAAIAAIIVIAFAVKLFGGPDLFAWLAGEDPSQITSSESVSEEESDSSLLQSSSQSAAAAGREMKVHFLDVGQADCIVVELPNDRTMVIDAGNNGDGKLIVKYLQALEISQIDYLIGTHPHEDHIGGLDNLIREFAVKALYMPKVSEKLTPTTATYNDVLEAAENKKMKIKTAKAGITLFQDDSIGLKAEILAPNASTEYSDLNNYSAVIRLTYGSRSFLFTGDAEEESEKIILNSGTELSADVLKLGHHGSSSSSSNAFLDAVAPEYAIISCETGNDYGHPHKETMEKMQERSIQIFRTDTQQTIIAVCDGTALSFVTGQQSCNNK